MRPEHAVASATAGVLLLVACTVTGCDSPGRPPAVDVRRALGQLRVVERPGSDPRYRRAAFGRAWADVDHDGCNTRDGVLYATVDKSRPFRVRRQGGCRTDMVAGTWTDLYTGATMTWSDLKSPRQAEGLPLDHIVSLAGAWRYGARDWTPQRRLELANDPADLTPTTAAVNRAKADHDAASWTPPAPGRCAYATRYVTVKARYQLAVDPVETAALTGMLDSCPP